jgi:hypothetical protein
LEVKDEIGWEGTLLAARGLVGIEFEFIRNRFGSELALGLLVKED